MKPPQELGYLSIVTNEHKNYIKAIYYLVDDNPLELCSINLSIVQALPDFHNQFTKFAQNIVKEIVKDYFHQANIDTKLGKLNWERVETQ